MKTYTLHNLSDYRRFITWAQANGYRRFQYQYGWSEPEGLHVIYTKDDEEIEIVTRDKEVEMAIVKEVWG